jgi:acyl carrier protein
MSTTVDRLTVLLTTKFGVGEDEVVQGVTFADLELDSLSLLEFALLARKEFNVPLDEDEVSAEDSLATMAKLIDDKMALVAGS